MSQKAFKIGKIIIVACLGLSLIGCEDVLNGDDNEHAKVLVFTESSHSITQGVCTRFVVQRRASNGQAFPKGTTMVTLRDTGTPMIFSDSGCTQHVRDPLAIPDGQTDLEFFVRSDDVVEFSISASCSGLSVASQDIETVPVVSKVYSFDENSRKRAHEIISQYLEEGIDLERFFYEDSEWEISFYTDGEFGEKNIIAIKQIGEEGPADPQFFYLVDDGQRALFSPIPFIISSMQSLTEIN